MRLSMSGAARTPGVVAMVFVSAFGLVASFSPVRSAPPPSAPATTPAITPAMVPAAAPGGVRLAPRLAFTNTVFTIPNNTDIFAVNLDGSAPGDIVVTPAPRTEFSPSWSPDGKRLAYMVRPGFAPADRAFIELADANGTNRETLVTPAEGRHLFDPAWSPDDRYIAFTDSVGDFGADSHLVVLDRVTKQQSIVPCPDPVEGFCRDTGAAWDPSRASIGDEPKQLRLAFSRGSPTGSSEIFTVTVDPPEQPGGKPQIGTPVRVTQPGNPEEPRTDSYPAWSPNGASIAYVARIEVSENVLLEELVTINPDGTNRRVLLDISGEFPQFHFFLDPAWSPDGAEIVFGAVGPGANNVDLWRIPTADGPVKLVTARPSTDRGPDFQPSADLVATLRAEPTTILQNKRSTVTLTVRNAGHYPARNATATLSIPAGLSAQGSQPSGVCTAAGSCSFGTIAPNTEVTVRLDVLGAAAGTHEIAVTALNQTMFEADPTDPLPKVSITVNTADISVTTTVTPPEIFVGSPDPLVVRYEIRNSGSGETGNVRFTATLPSVLPIVSVDVTDTNPGEPPPPCPTPTAGCDLGSFPTTRVVVIVVTLNPATAIISEAVGEVVAPDSTGDTSNNRSTAPIRVVTADIAVEGTAIRGETLVGRLPLVIQFKVSNSGTGSTGPVRFTATIPPGLGLASVQVTAPNGGPVPACPQPTQGCDLGAFSPTRVVIIQLTLSPNVAVVGQVTAEVVAPQSTGDTDDNRDSVNVRVDTLDLFIRANANPERTLVGRAPIVVTYTISNAGTGSTGPIRFTATLPAVLPIIGTPVVTDTDGSPPACPQPTAGCDLGEFGPGRTVTIAVTLSPDVPFIGEAIGEIEEEVFEGPAIRASARVAIRVDTADISVTVTATPPQTLVGGAPIVVRYTVTNTGTGPSGPVRFQATLPSELPVRSVVVSASEGAVPPCPQPAAGCDLGPFEPDRVVVIEVTLDPAAEFTGQVVGEVTAPESTGSVEDNIDRADIRVVSADIAVAVAVTPGRGFVGGDPLTARYTVRNAGSGATGPVQFTATLPGPLLPPQAVTVSANSGPVPACPTPTSGCDLGPFPVGREVVVEVTLNPLAAATGEAVGTVALEFESPGRQANNVARAPIEVVAPTLVITPKVGKPGIVPTIIGTNFPPGAKVLLRWDRGLTQVVTPITVDASGGFRIPMIIFHKDVKGVRAMVATHAANQPNAGPRFGPARDTFLVVIGTGQPDDWQYRR